MKYIYIYIYIYRISDILLNLDHIFQKGNDMSTTILQHFYNKS